MSVFDSLIAAQNEIGLVLGNLEGALPALASRIHNSRLQIDMHMAAARAALEVELAAMFDPAKIAPIFEKYLHQVGLLPMPGPLEKVYPVDFGPDVHTPMFQPEAKVQEPVPLAPVEEAAPEAPAV